LIDGTVTLAISVSDTLIKGLSEARKDTLKAPDGSDPLFQISVQRVNSDTVGITSSGVIPLKAGPLSSKSIPGAEVRNSESFFSMKFLLVDDSVTPERENVRIIRNIASRFFCFLFLLILFHLFC
jgi:hypothetical protein